jgi:hypothetical protein
VGSGEPRESGAVMGETAGGLEGDLEVWGLTGWYLSLLMRVLELY